jgi:uncharacterized protein YjbI with pentapeptide repeats
MADEEHLRRLKHGVDAWNTWREQNPDVVPDLSEADLVRINLTGANLARANLREANLVCAFLYRADLRNAELTYGANLSGADLQEAVLSGADLTKIRLVDADLSRAILTGGTHLGFADLSNARMSRTDLSGADLREAELDDVIFGQANLCGAYLGRAELFRTTFSGANLTGVDLEHAVVRETVFADVDLAQVKNLDTCEHIGPSIIDARTLQRSGQLPLSFLRGCGLRDWEIEFAKLYQQGLRQDQIIDVAYEVARIRGEQPIQFYSCFISYSAKDDDFAQRLRADLRDTGIPCWFAPEDMKIGDRIRKRIDEVIRLQEKLLLVLSANSINSDWVEKEVETAFEKELETKSTVLFPVRLDDAVMESRTGWAADVRRLRHIGDFRDWKDHDGYRKAFERLLRDLKVEPDPSVPSSVR